MPRIVIDLTEFATWSGHQTGVQRVVYGLALGLYNTTKNIKFITYAGGQGFRESSFEDLKRSLAVVESVQSTANTQAAKTLLKKIYQKSPSFVQQYFTPARKEALKRTLKSTRNKVRNLKNMKLRNVVAQPFVPFDFKTGDVILSAGRAWDDKTYVDTLEGLKKSNKVKLAYVVYDLVPIYRQHTFGPGLTDRYARYLYRVLQHADYVFPISESSKRDIQKFASEIGVLSLPVIETIRLGDDISEIVSDTAPGFVRDPQAFTITTGTIEARKNHMEIYYAYKLALQKGIELPDIYIIGKPGWLTGDVIYFIQNDADIKKKITIISNVNDRDLAWLYKNALYTVYPSEYEGWGLPIAESLAYGTPVIASNTSSMTEIAPKLVDHVSPFNPAELLEKMVAYNDKSVRDAKRKAIKSGYKLYTWEKTIVTITEAVKR